MNNLTFHRWAVHRGLPLLPFPFAEGGVAVLGHSAFPFSWGERTVGLPLLPFPLAEVGVPVLGRFAVPAFWGERTVGLPLLPFPLAEGGVAALGGSFVRAFWGERTVERLQLEGVRVSASVRVRVVVAPK